MYFMSMCILDESQKERKNTSHVSLRVENTSRVFTENIYYFKKCNRSFMEFKETERKKGEIKLKKQK